MTDLRKAAEELMPILERWKMTYPPCSGADWDKVDALRQALAQQGKECIYPECETGIGCDGPCGEKPVDTVNISQERVDKTAKRGHEPVAWMTHTNDLMPLFHMARKSALNWETQPTPLYTAPPKREWVGLTDKRILEIWTEQWNLHSKDYAENHIYYFGKAIEAALRSKNT